MGGAFASNRRSFPFELDAQPNQYSWILFGLVCFKTGAVSNIIDLALVRFAPTLLSVWLKLSHQPQRPLAAVHEVLELLWADTSLIEHASLLLVYVPCGFGFGIR